MKKTYLIGVIVLIIAIVIIGLTSKDKGNIKIGGTFALSGSLSAIGDSEKKGIEMAIDEINEKGGIKGRKLTLIAEDNAGDPKTGVSGVQKLISINKADIIFSAFTHITQAVAPVITETKIPLLYSSSDRTVAEGNNLFFRDYFDNIDIGKSSAQVIINNGYTNVKVISEINSSCDQIISVLEDEMKGKAVIMSKEYYQHTELDLRTHLAKLRLKDSDALFACSYRSVHTLMKNMSELNLLNTQTFQVIAPFLPVANTPETKELFSRNNTVSSWYGFAEKGDTEKQKEFKERYAKKFGTEPTPDSAYTYDDIWAMKPVLEKCYSDKLDTECYSAEMLKTNYDGVSGNLKFNDKGLSSRETLFIQAKNGVWEKI